MLGATKAYVLAYNEAAGQASDADSLIGAVSDQFPDLGGRLFLQLGAGARLAPDPE